MPLTTATVLLKKSPFTDEEVERAEAFARRLGLELALHAAHPPAERPHPARHRRRPRGVLARVPERHLAHDATTAPSSSRRCGPGACSRSAGRAGSGGGRTSGRSCSSASSGSPPSWSWPSSWGRSLLVRRRLAETPRRARLPLPPLLRLPRGRASSWSRWCCIQKCVLFLGHPAYALTVVLFALLLFSGLGSLAERPLRRRRARPPPAVGDPGRRRPGRARGAPPLARSSTPSCTSPPRWRVLITVARARPARPRARNADAHRDPPPRTRGPPSSSPGPGG